MTYLIALDDGHGMETAGKRTPKFNDGTFMHENEFNRVVVKYMDEILRRCGFKTLLVAPTDADTPLVTRVNLANKNKVDAYVSIHANAFKGVWGTANGVETFVGNDAKSKELGNAVHKYLLQGTKQTNRGVKNGSHLYVIRNTDAPAILAECAFMDHYEEAKLLLTNSFRKECAIEISKGICEFFKMKYVEEVIKKEEPVKVSNPTTPSTPTAPTSNTTDKTTKITIKKGDTLWAISKKYNLTIDEIKKLNKLESDELSIGQVLYLEAKKEEVKVTTPTPVVSSPAPSTSETYKVVKSINGDKTAADAKAKKNKASTVKAGTYYVFNKSNGMLNVTSKKGTAGSWINPSENVASTTTTTTKPSAQKTYKVVTTIAVYKSSDDAKAKKNKVATYKKGTYYIYKEANGMINISTKKNAVGSWINPSENKVVAVKKVKVDKVNSFTYAYKTTNDSATNRLGEAKKNSVYTLLGTSGAYYKVTYNGKTGYIKTKYCSIVK